MAFGITGISPLGSYGLGAGGAYGDYSSYMPSMMNYGSSGLYGNGFTSNDSIYNMGGMYGMGGMGAMLQYQNMAQMMQNQLEENQLVHNSTMHRGMVNNEVSANQQSHSGLIQKLLIDSSVQQGVYSLNEKILAGDMNGICQEYDKLRRYVYANYRDELASKGTKGNWAVDANQLIENVYGNLISARDNGNTHSLRQDIKDNSKGSFGNGVRSSFTKEKQMLYDEVINHIYGERVEAGNEKRNIRSLGRGVGAMGSAIEKGFIGAGVGAGSYATILAITSAIPAAFAPGKGIMKKIFGGGIKFALPIAAICAVCAMAYDACRQFTGKKTSAAA